MKLTYIEHYPQNIKKQVETLIESKRLTTYLKTKYPKSHDISSDKVLYNYVNEKKKDFFKNAYPLSKVCFDSKINVINNALGMHTFISRVQGNRLKAKNEIRVSTIFKKAPKEFLEMIVVHELAHLKEKEHNKAFYNLCEYMMSDYGQVEFDTRLYLIHLDFFGRLD